MLEVGLQQQGDALLPQAHSTWSCCCPNSLLPPCLNCPVLLSLGSQDQVYASAVTLLGVTLGTRQRGTFLSYHLEPAFVSSSWVGCWVGCWVGIVVLLVGISKYLRRVGMTEGKPAGLSLAFPGLVPSGSMYWSCGRADWGST